MDADATTERTSRNGASLPALRAATARSFHAARFIRGRSSSARVSSGSGDTSAAPLGPGAGVLLFDGVAHGGDTAPQQLLGHGELFGPRARPGRRCDGSTPSGAGGASSRCARGGRDASPDAAACGAPGRSPRSPRSVRSAVAPRSGRAEHARSRPGRASRPGPGGPSAALVALRRARRAVAPRRRSPDPRGRVGDGAPSESKSRRRPPGARTTDTPPGALSRPDPMISMRAALSVRDGVFGRQDRRHHDAVEVELGLGAQDVADLDARRGAERALERAARLAGPGGAPRPGAVVAAAGQLDVDPSRHVGSDHATVGTDTARTRRVARGAALAGVSVEVLRIRPKSAPGPWAVPNLTGSGNTRRSSLPMEQERTGGRDASEPRGRRGRVDARSAHAHHAPRSRRRSVTAPPGPRILHRRARPPRSGSRAPGGHLRRHRRRRRPARSGPCTMGSWAPQPPARPGMARCPRHRLVPGWPPPGTPPPAPVRAGGGGVLAGASARHRARSPGLAGMGGRGRGGRPRRRGRRGGDRRGRSAPGTAAARPRRSRWARRHRARRSPAAPRSPPS